VLGLRIVFVSQVLVAHIVVAHGLGARAVAVALGLSSRAPHRIAVVLLQVVGTCAVVVASRVLVAYVVVVVRGLVA